MIPSGDRQDGTTKGRVLAAATALFAEKGYRETTVQDICGSAGANVAAVNYHFGTKEQLYVAVWERLFGAARGLLLPPQADDADPWQSLAEYIRQRVRHAFCDGDFATLRLIIHREMANPTDAHKKLFRRFIEPVVRRLTTMVAAVLDRPADSIVVRRCTFSIQSQIIFVGLARIKKHPMRHLFDSTKPSEAEVEELAEHLVEFAAGGLRAAGKTPGKGDKA